MSWQFNKDYDWSHGELGYLGMGGTLGITPKQKAALFRVGFSSDDIEALKAVSYTHLTLPTKA